MTTKQANITQPIQTGFKSNTPDRALDPMLSSQAVMSMDKVNSSRFNTRPLPLAGASS
jgi:hypothetical protein